MNGNFIKFYKNKVKTDWVYINPDSVDYLYKSANGGTYIVTRSCGENEPGVYVEMQIDEVANILMGGGKILDIDFEKVFPSLYKKEEET